MNKNAPAPSAPRGALAWAAYDWANSAFATTVVAGFFPVFFKDYWSAGTPATVSTFWLGVTVSLASLAVALTAPVLGCLADSGGRRKRFLAFFAGAGVLLTALLPLIPRGAWPVAALVYGLAFVAWISSCVFYDSLIVAVSTPETSDRVSGLGFSLGYLGGGLLFAFNVLMTLKPEIFGLLEPGSADPSRGTLRAVQVSFLTVAAWWSLFSIPLLLKVKEPGGDRTRPVRQAAREGLAQLRRTFHDIRRLRPILAFLVAYWLYIDGVDTVITMAVDYGKSVGFATTDLITALLLVQFVAFPFAYLFGWLGQRVGTRRMILAGLLVYLGVCALATRLTPQPWSFWGFSVNPFYAMAFLIGTSQGGVQALSRSFYSRLIPREKSGEFFGFYNMVGRFGAILGPVLMGSFARFTGDPRWGLAPIAALLLGGGILLALMDEKAALAAASRE